MIIPVVDEADRIVECVRQFTDHPLARALEVIVVDGGSVDDTPALARQAGAEVLHAGVRSRAIQMNLGVQHAHCSILYFVHADIEVPKSFVQDIKQAIYQGYAVGCYRARFERNRGLIRINSYLNRFGKLVCRGGDQTMFITRELFERMSGFDEKYTIMEDFDFVRRVLDLKIPFHIIPKDVIVSLRKYKNNSWLRVQYANAVAMLMFTFGRSPQRIKSVYGKLLNYRPLNYRN